MLDPQTMIVIIGMSVNMLSADAGTNLVSSADNNQIYHQQQYDQEDRLPSSMDD